MKKTILFLFLLGIIIPKIIVAQPQSQYYYRTGDTIVGRSPIYFYQWWSEAWLADTSHRLALTRVLWHDGFLNYELFGGAHDLIPHGELLQYCYTEIPIQIIGIATSAVVAGPSGIDDLGGEPEYQEYLRLYEADRDNFTLLEEVPFDRHTEKRYMKVTFRARWLGNACCYQETPDTNKYICIREHYFEKPVTVSDSFYVGITTESHFHDFPAEVTSWPFPNLYVNDLSLYWDSEHIYRSPESPPCTSNCESTPYILHKFRHIRWNGTNDTVDASWHWWNSPYFLLEFPIVVIDSSWIIPPYQCPPVTNLRIAHQDEGRAVLYWDSHADHNSFQTCFGLQGTPPDSCTRINNPIQVADIRGLDSCTHYDAYVRGVCYHVSTCYSEWVGPIDIYICDTTSSGGGDDTLRTVMAMNVLTNIVPNPATMQVIVYSSFEINHISVFDANGKMVYDNPVSGHTAPIDIKGWTPGLYIVIVHTSAGNAAKKLICK